MAASAFPEHPVIASPAMSSRLRRYFAKKGPFCACPGPRSLADDERQIRPGRIVLWVRESRRRDTYTERKARFCCFSTCESRGMCVERERACRSASQGRSKTVINQLVFISTSASAGAARRVVSGWLCRRLDPRSSRMQKALERCARLKCGLQATEVLE